MTNPSLREIDEQFDKRLNNGDWGRPIHVSDLKSFIHKVIAERDEALRKAVENLNTSAEVKNNAVNVYNVSKEGELVYKSDVLSLLSKE